MNNKKKDDKVKLIGGIFNVTNVATNLEIPFVYKEESLGEVCSFCGKQTIHETNYEIETVLHLNKKSEVVYIGLSKCGRTLMLPKEKIALVYDDIFNQ